MVSNHLFYLLVFGVVLYRAFERHLVPRFGAAKQAMGNESRLLLFGAIVRVVGGKGDPGFARNDRWSARSERGKPGRVATRAYNCRLRMKSASGKRALFFRLFAQPF